MNIPNSDDDLMSPSKLELHLFEDFKKSSLRFSAPTACPRHLGAVKK